MLHVYANHTRRKVSDPSSSLPRSSPIHSCMETALRSLSARTWASSSIRETGPFFDLDESTKKTISNAHPMNLKNSQSTANLLGSRNPSFTASSLAHQRPLTSVSSSPALDKLVDTLTAVERLDLISDQLTTNASFLSRISNTLPCKDPYLKVILGGVDVSILNKEDKWTYKQQYEQFKFIVTCISLVSSLVIWLLTSRYRAFDALFHFLLVWYYCTLTIRESILIVNGSNINRQSSTSLFNRLSVVVVF
jgi:hypothetical protein